MLVDLNQKFVNMDGKIIKDISIIEDDNGVQTRVTKDLTLERVVSLALVEPVDQKMSGDNRIKCFELLLRATSHKDGVVELEVDDVSYIKTLIKPKFNVLVVGEAMRMLEGKDIGIEIVEEKIDPPEGIEPDKPDLPSPEKEDGKEPESEESRKINEQIVAEREASKPELEKIEPEEVKQLST